MARSKPRWQYKSKGDHISLVVFQDIDYYDMVTQGLGKLVKDWRDDEFVGEIMRTALPGSIKLNMRNLPSTITKRVEAELTVTNEDFVMHVLKFGSPEHYDTSHLKDPINSLTSGN